jgi:tetratricopeptide (TPR) repeat protein
MERDEAYLKKAVGTLAQLDSGDPASLHRARTRLNLATLMKRARNTDGEEEGLSAQRVLESVFVHAAFYAPRDLMEQGDYERAILHLSIASEIRPENPYVWYNLARVQARIGREGAAVKSLHRAVDSGLNDPDRLEEEPDLTSLQDREDFIDLLNELNKKREQ